MDPLHFAYWLRGYTEITNGAQPDAVQWRIIQDHLNEVFVKVTPNRHDPTLPRSEEPTYCGARPSVPWLRPAGDGVVLQMPATNVTC